MAKKVTGDITEKIRKLISENRKRGDFRAIMDKYRTEIEDYGLNGDLFD